METEKRREPIKVKRGEPFSVIPTFSNIPSELKRDELKRIEAITVEVEGLGLARINFSIDSAFGDQDPVETPAGEISVVSVLNNNSGNYDTKTLPIDVTVEVYGADKDVLDRTTCEITAGGNRFIGELTRDEIPLDPITREVTDAACFYGWLKPGVEYPKIVRSSLDAPRRPTVYFPQKPDVFADVKFIIS